MSRDEYTWTHVAGGKPLGTYILRRHPDPRNPLVKRAVASVRWIEVLQLWRVFYRGDTDFPLEWVPASTHAFLKDAQATAMAAVLLTD